jgi:hypothetical protein
MDLPVQLLEARNQPLARLLVAHHDRGAVQAPRLSGQVVCRRRLGQLVDQQVVGVVPQRQRLVEDGQSKTRDLAARAAHVAGGDEREGEAQIVTHNARLLACPSDPSAHDDPLSRLRSNPRVASATAARPVAAQVAGHAAGWQNSCSEAADETLPGPKSSTHIRRSLLWWNGRMRPRLQTKTCSHGKRRCRPKALAYSLLWISARCLATLVPCCLWAATSLVACAAA